MKTLYTPYALMLLLLTSCFTVRVAEDRPYEPTPPPREVVYEQPRYEPAPVPARSPAPPPLVVEEQIDPYYENEEYREPRSPDYREPAINDRLRRIQIALILDTSGSMEDLLEHAKLEFWYIIDELMASYSGPEYPLLEVALYQYGLDRRGRYNDYIRQVVPLTSDLDWIADELWQLRSKGNNEFDGLVIDRAVRELNWSYEPGAVRMIYIIGNETFRDGPVRPQIAIENACDRGIDVHTLFCGSYREGQRMGWEEASWCGTYTALDYHAPVESYVSSYDYQLHDLNIIYNQTFLPYGDFGTTSYNRCIRQDGYLQSYGPSWISVRTVVKSGPYYSNPRWDLIDAIDCGQVTFSELPREQWPVSLRGKSMREAERIISEKRKQRTQLQAQIRRLNQDRRKEIQQARARKPSEGRQYRSIDQAVMGTIRGGLEGPTRTPRTPRTPDLSQQEGEGPGRNPRTPQTPRMPNLPEQEVEGPSRNPRTPIPPRKDLEEQRKEVEIIRQKQLEQQRREAEVRRQKQLDEQRKEAEVRRQRELEQQRREAEVRRQKQLDEQRKEAEVRRQRELEQQRREAEVRRQKQLDEQRKEAEVRRQRELEQQRREAEVRRQKQLDEQRKEAEVRRQRELEQQRREAEVRRQKQLDEQRKEAEVRRQRELEQQRREAEVRRQKQLDEQRKEAEVRRQRELEQQRREAEVRRQRQQEQQRKEAEARRQRELEQQRREAEVRRQRQQEQQRKEAEARRQRELEQQRREAEVRRQRQLEQQRKEAEARRQRELEQQRREAEVRRQRQQEQQRKEAEARRQREQEQQRKAAEAKKQQPQTRKASGSAVRRR